MAGLRIRDHIYDLNDPGMQGLLAQLHTQKERPHCVCVSAGVPMYIAKVEGRYFVKRMPNSGAAHSPECESFEPPDELSGLGQVQGTAIQEDPESGTVLLKFDFSLSKGATRKAPAPSDTEKDTVRTDGAKLTLRGTLHYLWEQAGFNRWSPAMEGKRNWFTIRKYLLQSAVHKVAKGTGLEEFLYVPESFSADRKEEIAQRRRALMLKHVAHGDKRSLLILVGEVKEIVPAQFGHKLVVKHVPDCHFMLAEDIHRRLLKRFATELDVWNASASGDSRETRLIVISTFSVTPAGVAHIEELALMPVTDNYVPFENLFDLDLIKALSARKRRFVKGLRYNLPSDKPMAAAILTDAGERGTALYVTPPGASDELEQATDEAIAGSEYPSWRWHAAREAMPALPEPR